MPEPIVRLHPSLEGKMRALVLWAGGVVAGREGGAYRALEEEAARWRAEWEGTPPGQVPAAAEGRRLYRHFGIDASRTRPSSEALLRRALKGMELYRIDDVVDLGNLVSLRHQLPLGLYDLDHVVGEEVWIRVGEEGAAYEGIRKGEVHLSGRLCVADVTGPFGSPTSDSHRTRIREGTRRVLAILFAPIEGDRERLLRAGEDLEEAFRRFARADAVERTLLEP